MLSVIRATLAPPSVIHSILLAVLSSKERLNQSEWEKETTMSLKSKFGFTWCRIKTSEKSLTFEEISSAFWFRDVWLVCRDLLYRVSDKTTLVIHQTRPGELKTTDFYLLNQHLKQAGIEWMSYLWVCFQLWLFLLRKNKRQHCFDQNILYQGENILRCYKYCGQRNVSGMSKQTSKWATAKWCILRKPSASVRSSHELLSLQPVAGSCQAAWMVQTPHMLQGWLRPHWSVKLRAVYQIIPASSNLN